MESPINNPLPLNTNYQSNTNSFFIIFISFSILVIGTIGGFILGVWTVSNQVSTPSLQSAQILPKTQSSNQFENTTYLMRLTARGPENERTILITMDGSGETLKLADIDLSEAGSKTLHSFEFPSPVGFAPPFYIVDDYIIAPVAGADANDILIFTLQGAPISLGVRQNNTELANWLVFYDEWVKENVVKVKLFGVDDSTGTAQIDLTTGQIVPGSYLELGKFQESNN